MTTKQSIGQWNPEDSASEFNRHLFLIKQTLSLISTASIVQVQSVTTTGAVAPVGYVDVLPLVNMQDGSGNQQKHSVIHNVPYFRLQGGANAIICDPQIGDIGICIFSDRDLSNVKKNAQQGGNNNQQPAGSRRRFDMADGLYIGGVLNAVPTQYVQFLNGGGINVKDTFNNTIVTDNSGITVNGVKFDRSQNITNIQEATSKGSVTLTQHKHHQGVDGHGDTEPDVSVPFN